MCDCESANLVMVRDPNTLRNMIFLLIGSEPPREE